MNDFAHPIPPTSSLVASICHCSSPHEHSSRAADTAAYSANAEKERVTREAATQVAAAERELAKIRANTPDATRYEIEDVREVGPHLVMKVKYPNCAACEYEGNKVMVFLNVTPLDAMRWKKIDPHFRAPQAPQPNRPARVKNEAPSPAARFPGSVDGWADALEYCRTKMALRTDR